MTKQERMAIRDEAAKKLLERFPEADNIADPVEWELMKMLVEGTADNADEIVDKIKDQVEVFEHSGCGVTTKTICLVAGIKGVNHSDFIVCPDVNPWGHLS